MSVVNTRITDTRRLTVERARGRIEWRVNEFDGGLNVMLVAESAGVQFMAHFTGEQWADFQKLVGA